MPTSSAELIEHSFELAAERCHDLTPLVYERLFREQPQMRELFLLDRNDGVKGSMLEWTIRAILDFTGDDSFGRNVIRSEAVNHSRNGVRAAEFPIFFRALADTLRDLLGADWTASTEQAWQELLDRLQAALPETP